MSVAVPKRDIKVRAAGAARRIGSTLSFIKQEYTFNTDEFVL